MALQNQISVTFTDEQTSQIRTAFQTLTSLLRPQLVQLSPQSRQELPKMGDKSIGFVSKALEFAGNNPDYTPKYFDLDGAQIDFKAVTVLREFAGPLSTLAELVNDTMMLSGSEAYAAALSFYSAVKSAAKDNQPGARIIYEDLKARFPRGTTSSEPAPVIAK